MLTEIAAGRHLSTLAFSEFGSRSHFWAPVSTATREGGDVRLDARKSWVTAAGEADSYVWSSKPLAAAGPMTLWYVPADAPGLDVPAPFDGLGLRGNASSPVTAAGVSVPESAMLGADGGGLDLALTVVLPFFLVLNASASVGLMQAVTQETAQHLQQTRLEHLGQIARPAADASGAAGPAADLDRPHPRPRRRHDRRHRARAGPMLSCSSSRSRRRPGKLQPKRRIWR